MANPIQVFKPLYRTDEVLEEIKECLVSGWTGSGFKTSQFEEKWMEYTGLGYCHFLNSATSGLHLAVKIFKDFYNWQEGDEVITTAFTFVSTNHAILYERLSPVFADIDETLCLNPSSVERMITEKTKAIVYVGIGGNAANYSSIADICKRNNLKLILDAAHMSGTKWAKTNIHVGHDADCAVFSYQAVKNCPSADSGAICFKKKELDKIARELSWLGIDKSTYSRVSREAYKWHYDVNELGFKYHGNSVMAAIALVSLKYLEQDNDRRRQIAMAYDNGLRGNPSLKIISHSSSVLSSRHLFQITTQYRDKLIEMLALKGICCGVHYIENTSYNIFKTFRSDMGLKFAKYYSDHAVSLPLHLCLNDADVQYIISSVNEALC